MFLTASFALSALALSAHDPEPAEPAEPTEVEAEKPAAEEKKICRRVVDGMGSRRKVKLCYTKEQWREYNRGQ